MKNNQPLRPGRKSRSAVVFSELGIPIFLHRSSVPEALQALAPAGVNWLQPEAAAWAPDHPAASLSRKRRKANHKSDSGRYTGPA
ncbi:MAG: hypothetical protein R3D58_17335 [Saprospiraceae bacterium]